MQHIQNYGRSVFCLFVCLIFCSCWIAVGDGTKGAIWAFVVPVLIVTLVSLVPISSTSFILSDHI